MLTHRRTGIAKNKKPAFAGSRRLVIWEYDPTQDNNRVLGGSLDVIVAICVLAIKVSADIDLQLGFKAHTGMRRFKRLNNALNTSEVLRPEKAFLKRSRFPFAAIFDGQQHQDSSVY